MPRDPDREAGTGTVRRRLSGARAAFGRVSSPSTGTRALQDQLYHRDLPKARRARRQPEDGPAQGRRIICACIEWSRPGQRSSSRSGRAIPARGGWSGRSQRGDLSELPELPDDSPLLPQVTSTADNCLGSECPFWADCFVVKARSERKRRWWSIITCCSPTRDQREGFGEILPVRRPRARRSAPAAGVGRAVFR
jgi:ATP-dependent DNA helicase DinG